MATPEVHSKCYTGKNYSRLEEASSWEALSRSRRDLTHRPVHPPNHMMCPVRYREAPDSRQAATALSAHASRSVRSQIDAVPCR